jgi:hypothetical protein
VEEPTHNYGEAEAELTALYVFAELPYPSPKAHTHPDFSLITHSVISLSQTQHAYRIALCDSFNTPEAMQKVLDLVSRTNVYVARGRSRVNVGVVAHIARWVTTALKVFGLSGDGPGAIGWGAGEEGSAGTIDVSELDLYIYEVFVDICAYSERRSSCLICVLCPGSEIRFDSSLCPELPQEIFWRCVIS